MPGSFNLQPPLKSILLHPVQAVLSKKRSLLLVSHLPTQPLQPPENQPRKSRSTPTTPTQLQHLHHDGFRPLKTRSKQRNPLRQQRPLRTLRPTDIPAHAGSAARAADATSPTDASDAASAGTDKAENEEKESPQGPGVVRGHMSAAYLWWLARRLFVTGSAVRCFDCGFILT